jgi:hypothetical protein
LGEAPCSARSSWLIHAERFPPASDEVGEGPVLSSEVTGVEDRGQAQMFAGAVARFADTKPAGGGHQELSQVLEPARYLKPASQVAAGCDCETRDDDTSPRKSGRVPP